MSKLYEDARIVRVALVCLDPVGKDLICLDHVFVYPVSERSLDFVW